MDKEMINKNQMKCPICGSKWIISANQNGEEVCLKYGFREGTLIEIIDLISLFLY